MLRVFLLIFGLSIWTSNAWAQGRTPTLGPDGTVGASLELRPAASRIADRLLPLLGVAGGVHLSPWVELAGEAVVALRRVRVSPDDSPDRSELTLGYGGVSLRYHLSPGSSASSWSGALLVGAGTARVRSTLVGQDVGTDNFFVVEPNVSYQRYFRPNVAGAVSGAYRFTPGFDPLPGLEAGSLRGFVLSLSVRFVRHP